MVSNYFIGSAVSSMSDENSVTIINQDSMALNQNLQDKDENFRQEKALEIYSHEDFDKIVRDEESHKMSANSKNLRDETAHQGYGLEDSENLVRFENINQNREGNGKLSQESAFESYNHQDFDSLVQDESQMKKSIKIHSESAFKNYNHQDFDNLVRNEKTSENNIKVRAESAFKSYNHQDFDNLVQNDETSDNNIEVSAESVFKSYKHQDFDNLVQEEETSKSNINLRAESAFKSYNHHDFDDLVETKTNIVHQDDSMHPSESRNNDNNSYKEADTVRQEVVAYDSANGFGKPTDIKRQDPLTEVPVELPRDPLPIVPAAHFHPDGIGSPAEFNSNEPLSENFSALTEDSIQMVTAPPFLPDMDTENANILQKSDPNSQMVNTYIAFFILVAAILSFFLSLQVARRRRSMRQKRDIYQYLGGFNLEDIDMRPAITGGWHGQYKNNLAQGCDGDFENYSDSDDASGSCNSGLDEDTIVLLEQGDLSSPLESFKRPLPFTLLIGDRNIYLDESNAADSDDEDIFAPVRTRPF
jgi:hypothetical protein